MNLSVIDLAQELDRPLQRHEVQALRTVIGLFAEIERKYLARKAELEADRKELAERIAIVSMNIFAAEWQAAQDELGDAT